MSKPSTQGKWYGPWCSYFVALLEERRLNPTDFALLIGDRQNNVWQYMRGIIRPPLKKLEMWARRLKLDDKERTKFIRLARMAHAPADLRIEMEELRSTNLANRAELAALHKLLAEHGLQFPE